jgi:hypothetical protein
VTLASQLALLGEYFVQEPLGLVAPAAGSVQVGEASLRERRQVPSPLSAATAAASTSSGSASVIRPLENSSIPSIARLPARSAAAAGCLRYISTASRSNRSAPSKSAPSQRRRASWRSAAARSPPAASGRERCNSTLLSRCACAFAGSPSAA